MTHLVVVGASLAGLRAVESARRAGFDGTITLLGAEPHLPYDRPPLSKAFLGLGGGSEHPPLRSERSLRDDLKVELRLGEPAEDLDLAARRVTTGQGDLDYDSLIVATGARARELPGERLGGVYPLRTVDDAIAVRARLDAGARTVVIGAGFIGSEIASAAYKRGNAVTIVEAAEVPLVRAVGEVMGHRLTQVHRRHGTDIRCSSAVAGIEGEGAVEAVVLSDGTRLPADLVIVGVGAIPNTEWLAKSGLRIADGIVCDEYLAAADGVYVAGDVARWTNPLFGMSMRLEHWTSAVEQGMAAARNAVCPDDRKTFTTVPYFWSDWYDTRIQFVGITQADEVRVADESDDGGMVALYRQDARAVGALAIGRPTLIPKLRALIARSGTWDDALQLTKDSGGALASRSRS